MAYSTGETILKAKIHNEKDVTPEFILNEAKQMWAECKKQFKEKKIKFGDAENTEQLINYMRNSHKDFCKSYPIVMRYMAEMHTFHANAFRKYLKKIAANPWKTEDEYLDSQADYICMLYKETHKRWNATDVSRIKFNIRNLLQNEHDTVKKYKEEFTKEVESDIERFQKESKIEMVAFLKSLNGKPHTEELANEIAKIKDD